MNVPPNALDAARGEEGRSWKEERLKMAGKGRRNGKETKSIGDFFRQLMEDKSP